MDVSPSAMEWGSEIHSDVRRFYAEAVPDLVSAQPDRLQTGLVTIGKTAEFPVRLTAEPGAIVTALDGLRIESSGREVTFAAVQQALQEYLPQRTREHREVVFVLITDESGDDWEQVDQLINAPRSTALPIYVVGVPAPFGRTAGLDPGVESGKSADTTQAGNGRERWQPILQGPESRGLEAIPLEFEEINSDLELLDSGFGPFGLEWLCRVSGGAFFAVRDVDLRSSLSRARRSAWPTVDAASFEVDRWRRLSAGLGRRGDLRQPAAEERRVPGPARRGSFALRRRVARRGISV